MGISSTDYLMTEYIGLRHLLSDFVLYDPGSDQGGRESQLKRNILLFDRIGILFSDFLDEVNDDPYVGEWANNISWLIEQNVCFPVPNHYNSEFVKSSLPELQTYISELEKFNPAAELQKIDEVFDQINGQLDEYKKTLKNIRRNSRRNPGLSHNRLDALEQELEAFPQNAKRVTLTATKSLMQFESNLLRIKAMEMASRDRVSVIPLLSIPDYFLDVPTATKSDVIEIVIRKLPLPSATTSWEAILDYRNDSGTKKSLRALRNWMRKVSSKNLPVIEIEEEIESLTDEFQNHMKLHKLKANVETLQTLVKAPLGVIESLLHLQPTKIIDPLFVFHQRQLSLMEAEINAPGKEIAYILETKETFYESD